MDYSDWIGDAHTDAILCLEREEADLVNWGRTQWDLAKCAQAQVKFQIMALFIESRHKPERALPAGLHLLEMAHDFVAANRDKVFLIESGKDLARLPDQSRLGLMLSVEGGEILGGQVWMVDLLHRLGIRSLGLTWNQRNDLADGAGEHEANGGLTQLGKKVVRRLNQKGIAVDVSHLAERSFWDVLDVAEQPPFASHSCAAALCPHPRNLSDEQIKALVRAGGIVGINFYAYFLHPQGEADRHDIIRHIRHIADLVGPEYIALGSDFDGVEERLEGLEDVSMVPLLLEDLSGAGFSVPEIAGIAAGNLVNYFKKILK